MFISRKRKIYFILFLLLAISILPGCNISQKIDNHVAEHYNNELPKPDKKKNAGITVNTSIPSDPKKISVTEKKTSKVLPLLIYWQYDYRRTCTMNPLIGVSHFRKTINQQTNKLNQKLDGQQLELNVEQVPGAFAVVDKGHIVLFVVHWHKFYVEPDFKDLVVSYKVLKNGNETKTGKITIANKQQNEGIGYFQSLRSLVSDFLGRYNNDMADMSKNFVNKLLEELE